MKKIFLIICFVVILIQFSSAYISLNIYLDEKGEALFLGETDEKILELPQGIKINGGIIKGTTNSLTNKQGEIWEFSYELIGAELNVVFPKETIIKNLEDGEISFDKQISIFVEEKIKVNYLIEDSKNYNYLFYLIGILIFFVSFFCLFRLKLKKRNNLEILKQTLNEREKKIIEKLQEVKKIKHSRLQNLVDIPKASFSRHVQELERKDLIKKTGDGKNKFLSLK